MREPQNYYGTYNFHIEKFHGKPIHSPKIKHTTGRLSNAVLLSYYHGMTRLLETYFVFQKKFFIFCFRLINSLKNCVKYNDILEIDQEQSKLSQNIGKPVQDTTIDVYHTLTTWSITKKRLKYHQNLQMNYLRKPFTHQYVYMSLSSAIVVEI